MDFKQAAVDQSKYFLVFSLLSSIRCDINSGQRLAELFESADEVINHNFMCAALLEQMSHRCLYCVRCSRVAGRSDEMHRPISTPDA
jgi:hypothetical protein